MRQRGKLGLTFTTERCKKLDIIHHLTGVKLMYFQAQWRKAQEVNSLPSKRGIPTSIYRTFTSHLMLISSCCALIQLTLNGGVHAVYLHVCVFLQHASPAVSRMKNGVYSL